MTTETVLERGSQAQRLGVPLYVDLDGTLLRTDTLVESVVALLRQRPWLLLLLPLWLLRGRARLKDEVARRVELNVESLPYHDELLAFLRAESLAGRRIVLATAADRRIAVRVAEHLGLFADVIASDAGRNLKGEEKLAAIRADVGDGPFDYAGDSPADVAIWAEARKAIVVTGSRAMLRRARGHAEVEQHFDGSAIKPRTVLKAIRVHQWVKNVLIFVPLILAHRPDPVLVLQGVAAFFAMSLLASCVYLINDLFDLEADRRHATKRRRPLASGALPLHVAGLLMPVLLGTSAVLTALLPPAFAVVLAVYFALTTGYSFRFKRVVLIDVLMLAGLYTIRILAGSMATGVPVSEWLLGFSMFFFLSLAFVKRYSELRALRDTSGGGAMGRGYYVQDADLVGTMGVASGYLAILVMALYVTGDKVVALYARPELLWLVCLLLLYWISRIWFLTYRGQMHDDPVVFAIKDRQSYVLGLIAAATLLLSTRALPF